MDRENRLVDRRQFLSLAGIGTTAAVAGCVGDDDNGVSEADEELTDEEDSSDDDTSDDSESEDDVPLDEQTFEIGDPVEFSGADSDGKLVFQPHSPRLSNGFLVPLDSASLGTHTPDDFYLMFDIEMEADGSDTVHAPDPFELEIDGQQYQSEMVLITDHESYSPFEELPTDQETVNRVAFFPIPELGSSISLNAEWGLTDAMTAEWTIDTDDVDVDSKVIDYEGNGVGDFITVSAQERSYEFGVTDFEFVESYTYSVTGGTEATATADPGRIYLLATLHAESMGDEPVIVPRESEISLFVDDEEYIFDFYHAEDEYEGGELSPGSSETGIVKFHVPEDTEDVEDLTIKAEIGSAFPATWEI